MGKDALAECGEDTETPEALAASISTMTRRSPDQGLGYRSGVDQQGHRLRRVPSDTREQSQGCGIPQVPSTLWNSMLKPLATTFQIAGWLWYQGAEQHPA